MALSGKGWIAGLASLLAIVATTGCGLSGSEESGSSGSGDVTIGLLAPITGTSAADGEGMKQGAEVAIRELNAGGGVGGRTLKLKTIDTQDLQAAKVAAGVQQLVSDPDVKAAITSYASQNNFEIESFAEAGMPYLVAANADQTAAMVSRDPGRFGTVWSFVPSYDAYGTELPKVIEQWDEQGKLTLHDKSVFVITSDNPFSQGISRGLLRTLDERGWNVKGEETVPFGPVNDWGPILAKVRSADPDLIVDTDYLPANEATFLKQFRANPTRSILFMQYGPSIPEFLELTRDTSNGLLYSVIGDPIHSPRWPVTQELTGRLARALGQRPDAVNNQAILTYTQVMLYASALRAVGDPDKKAEIGEWIGRSKTVLPGGTLRFDPRTHLAVYDEDPTQGTPLQILQLWGGRRNLLRPDSLATADLRVPPWY